MSEKKGLLIVFSGPSGVGKGTLLNHIMRDDRNLICSVSATTRPPREGECNGKHYYFIDRDRFKEMIRNDELLEYAEYSGNYYGTPKAQVNNLLSEGYDVVLEIEVQGALQIKKLYPEAVMIFVIPPSVDVLRSRLRNRQTEPDRIIAERLATAIWEIENARNYDYIIVNDDRTQAVEDLRSVIRAAHLTRDSMTSTLDEVLENA